MKKYKHGIDKNFVLERIKALREQKGISESKLSLGIGHSKNYFTNITQRKTMPPIKELLAICDYFDVAPTDFFNPDLDNLSLISMLAQTARKLSDDDLKVVLSVANQFKKKSN